jgi:enhancing lycopene biosynthesis protein 2
MPNSTSVAGKAPAESQQHGRRISSTVQWKARRLAQHAARYMRGALARQDVSRTALASTFAADHRHAIVDLVDLAGPNGASCAFHRELSKALSALASTYSKPSKPVNLAALRLPLVAHFALVARLVPLSANHSCTATIPDTQSFNNLFALHRGVADSIAPHQQAARSGNAESSSQPEQNHEGNEEPQAQSSEPSNWQRQQLTGNVPDNVLNTALNAFECDSDEETIVLIPGTNGASINFHATTISGAGISINTTLSILRPLNA